MLSEAIPGERSGIRAGMVRLKAGADLACSKGDVDSGLVVFIGPYPVGVDVHQVKVAIKAQPSGLVRDPGLDERVTGRQDAGEGLQQVKSGGRVDVDGHPHVLLGRLELGRGREDLLAVDLEGPLKQYEITHVEADLLDDLVAGQHVGTAGPLVLDLVGAILIPLGPAIDRRVELKAEGLNGIAGVEVEQAVVVR